MKKIFRYLDPFVVIFIGTLLLIGLISISAIAQECRSPSDIHNEIVAFYFEQNRETKQVYHFEGEQAQNYLAFYNALPPITNLVGDEVVVYMTLPSPVVTVVIFLDGCFVAGGASEFETYQGLWIEFYEKLNV